MINSFSNPFIKSLKKLSDHKQRMVTGKYLIEGLRIVGEAIDSQQPIESLIYARDLLISEFGLSLIDKADNLNCEMIEVSKEVFSSISGRDGPQGIAAILKQKWTSLADILTQNNDLWIALESIQNPGNLGTILRTVDAVGAKGVILLDNSTDPFDPTAVKASMGALFNLALVKSDYETFSYWINQFQIPVIGSSDSAKQDYQYFQYPPNCVLLMGSERQGLPEKYQDICTEIVRIPMEGSSDSLNLAIATSIILYQIYNQRRSG